MWMSNQYHLTSQHLAHCPITRHHNLCNFIKMQFIIKNSYWKNFAILQHDWTCKNKPMPARATTRPPGPLVAKTARGRGDRAGRPPRLRFLSRMAAARGPSQAAFPLRQRLSSICVAQSRVHSLSLVGGHGG